MSEISLKQILAMRSCPRAFAAKNLFQCEDPKSPHMQIGIDFHASAEAWLKSGCFDFKRWDRQTRTEQHVAVPPESHLGKMVRAAVAFAPPGARPELNQTFDLFGRTTTCHIDALAPDWSMMIDWKSSSGYRELSKNTLHADVQANFQAYGVMKGSGQASIEGCWVYVHKKTYRAHAVQGTFRRDECEAFLRREALPAMQLIELFRQLHETGRLARLDQVPHDITACEGTGKFCSFLGQCQMKPSTGATLVQLRAHK